MTEFIQLHALAEVIAGALNRQRFPAASGAIARLVGITRRVMIDGERSNFKKNPMHTQDHGDA